VRAARFAIAGAMASVLILHGFAAAAYSPMHEEADRSASLYTECRGGIVGLGFGFGPWWGPYDSYAPPAYAYPPPVYSVPPPPRGTAQSQLGVCREFESTVIVDGQPRLARGLACPQPDGSWRIVR
jgi:hypothetical protein